MQNMKDMQHHNIIEFVDFFKEGQEKWYLVMNLADQGSLSGYLQARKDNLTEK